MIEEENEEPLYSRPSKSQVKRDLLELQKIAERLVSLPSSVIKKMEIPDAAKTALVEVQSLKREAYRRHIRLIGGIFRDIDSPELRENLLEALDQQHVEVGSSERQIKLWMQAFLEDRPTVLEEVIERFPQTDIQKLRQLARNAKKENQKNAAQESAKAVKASKALRTFLKTLLADATD